MGRSVNKRWKQPQCFSKMRLAFILVLLFVLSICIETGDGLAVGKAKKIRKRRKGRRKVKNRRKGKSERTGMYAAPKKKTSRLVNDLGIKVNAMEDFDTIIRTNRTGVSGTLKEIGVNGL